MRTLRYGSISMAAALVLAVLTAAMIFLPTARYDAYAATDEAAVFEQEAMRAELKAFVDGETGKERQDRTPFSEGEKAAAEYIAEKMSALTSFETETQEFYYEPSGVKEPTRYYSRNIVSIKRSSAERPKAVIIGANYDNTHSAFSVTVQSGRFSSSEQTLIQASGGSGAYVNGTGVATLLALASALDGEDLGFDLYVVYFGAGELWSLGAEKFVGDYMDSALLARTVLMVNLQRIGGDNLYAYGDEVRTDASDYFFGAAEKLGTDLKKVPSTLPRMPAKYIDGISYTHLGMLGCSSEFASRSVPVLNLFGGTFDTFSFGLDDMKGEKNIAYTENDTVSFLETNMGGYAEKMSQTAALLYGALTDEGFIGAVENSRDTTKDYSFFMKAWIPALIAIGALVAIGLIMIPVARHFEKKYPKQPPKKRKIKVAVFGMDYETPSEDDVYIDLKKRGDPPSSPFDGY